MPSRKITGLAASLIATLLVFGCGDNRDAYWREHPAEAFPAITQLQLPAGVRVVTLKTAVTDNLNHTSYFWLLAGAVSDLRKVVSGTGFGRSDDDARSYIPGATDMFGIKGPDAEMLEGYEWQKDRDSWYLILKGKEQAIYVH